MDIPEPVEEAHKVESKEILLRVLQQSIFAWILLEYYHSYSILVLLLRAVQAFATFRARPVTLDGIFVKGMGTVLVIVQIIICLLQLMGSSSSPAFLVFVGYTYAPSGLGVLLVDCVIGGLLYVNFTESTNSSTQQAGGEEVDIEAGLRRPLRRIRPRGR